jgi:hypothetical protein
MRSVAARGHPEFGALPCSLTAAGGKESSPLTASTTRKTMRPMLASDQPVGKDQKAEKADAKKEGHGPRTPMLSPEYREIEARVQ